MGKQVCTILLELSRQLHRSENSIAKFKGSLMFFTIIFGLSNCCNSNCSNTYVTPYISSTEMQSELRSVAPYSIKKHIKICASINLLSYRGNKSFDSALSYLSNNKILLSRDKLFMNVILPDSLLKLSANDVHYLRSLLNSRQTCFPSILQIASQGHNNYSTIGYQCRLILDLAHSK
jgi:hypothetical protein